MESKRIEFIADGYAYESNEKGNRFYKWLEGKKVRISTKEWEDAINLKWEEEADAEKKAREDKVEADAREAEEAVSKKAKKRAKKNVAFKFEDEDGEVTLTEKQVKFIKLLPNDEFYEHGLESTLWIDVLCDTLAGEFNPMALGAMVSTLREKYLIYVGTQRMNGKKCKYFGFTQLGMRVAKELGLE